MSSASRSDRENHFKQNAFIDLAEATRKTLGRVKRSISQATTIGALLGAAVAVVGLNSFAHAGLVVYDGFDYTAGNLNGQGTPGNASSNYGFNIGSTYGTGDTSVQQLAGSLTYAGTFGTGSGLLSASGGRISSGVTSGAGGGGNGNGGGLGGFRNTTNGNYTGLSQGGRPFGGGLGSNASTPVAPAIGTYYYSFLIKAGGAGYFNVFGVPNSPTAGTATANNDYQSGIGIRINGTTVSPNNLKNGLGDLAGIGISNTATTLIVGKFVYTGGANSSNQFWTNPTGFTSSGTVGTAGVGLSNGSITYTFDASNASTLPIPPGIQQTFTSRSNSNAAALEVDEVRVGTSLADVVSVPGTISLTPIAQNANLAFGGNVVVTGSNGNFISEVDDLTANQNSGSATISVTPGPLASPVFAMLWLTGQTTTTLANLRTQLNTLSGVAASIGVDNNAQFNNLNAGNYSGFSMLVQFTGAAAATPGSLNWNFGTQSSILVDKVAIVPEPTVMAGVLGLGSLGLLGRRRRS